MLSVGMVNVTAEWECCVCMCSSRHCLSYSAFLLQVIQGCLDTAQVCGCRMVPEHSH